MTTTPNVASVAYGVLASADHQRLTPIAERIADALMAGHDDVHLHRHPDGTVTVTPMYDAYDTLPGERVGIQLWVDVEGGA